MIPQSERDFYIFHREMTGSEVNLLASALVTGVVLPGLKTSGREVYLCPSCNIEVKTRGGGLVPLKF